MNIFRKTINNYKYAYHRIMREYHLKKVGEYPKDNEKFTYHARRFVYHLKKNIEIEIWFLEAVVKITASIFFFSRK